MSDEEYTPTTEEVRREWAERRADGYSLVMGDAADKVALAEFDRWLVSARRDEREKCAQIANALESLSAPSGDDREELEALIQGEDERWDGSKSSEDFSTRVAAAVLAAGFCRLSPVTRENPVVSAIEAAKAEVAAGRRASVVVDIPDPVTREALANWLGQYRAQVTEHPIWVADWDAADDFLSRFSLPEPAEVEWGLSDSMLDSFPEPHFTTKSEENARMNQRRGHPAIKVVNRTVTPWVPVEKGAEQ